MAAAAVGLPVPAASPAAAATNFTAKEDLNGRDGPSLNANTVKVDMYLKGHTVPVACHARGEEAYGSAIWDKTSDGVWVPDFYVQTGSIFVQTGSDGFAPGVPRCGDTSLDPASFPATADLDGRRSPSLSAAVVQVNAYRSGESVPVVCQATGDSAYGNTIWDKIADGLWVTDVHVKTGYSGFDPNLPTCSSTAPPNSAGYLAKTDLNGRATTQVSAPAVKVYPAGSTIRITCQAIGENAYGGNIWDKTTENLWVADYYVKTGTDGFLSNMPRCENDQPGGGSQGGDTGPSTGNGTCDTAGHGRIGGPAGSTAGTSAEKISRIIALAKEQTTKSLSYAWGGGKGGPSCGIASLSPGGCNDYNRYGFDCSGFTEYIFLVAAGRDIGANTNVQSVQATQVSYSSLKAGDLIFWGSPGNTDHVALYIGNGQIIEAAPPRGTSSVHVTNVYGSHTYAIRIFS
ncbi:NlpC/P60 family protein [Streptomyces sp. TLI_235]|nr:NlpC/P60 family protein [Streptomyces sp. TLI_235]PBC76998.1 NlpC/P60 family protein [Streptomyces sp. TLI_235]